MCHGNGNELLCSLGRSIAAEGLVFVAAKDGNKKPRIGYCVTTPWDRLLQMVVVTIPQYRVNKTKQHTRLDYVKGSPYLRRALHCIDWLLL